MLVVFGNFLLLERFLQGVIRVATKIAHGDTRVLGLVLDDLDQLLAPVLRQGRHRNPDGVAHRSGIEAEIRVADRLLDSLDDLLLEPRDAYSARLEQRA